jgi:hypothetical protein
MGCSLSLPFSAGIRAHCYTPSTHTDFFCWSLYA